MPELTGWDAIPDQPCGTCGHDRIVHITECTDGWRLVRGDYEPGPDACMCLRYLDPDGAA